VLAYAATVHKAQGSEYRIVVAPFLHRQHFIMLQRNLLYTCVTRAADVLVLVGSKDAIWRAISNDKPHQRNSMLRAKLLDMLPPR
jgi:exodeoxyribonuclease V alpha subunit